APQGSRAPHEADNCTATISTNTCPGNQQLNAYRGVQVTKRPASGTPGVRHVEVDAARAGQRLDNYLLGQLKGVPKSRVYRLLRRGEVRVNGGRAGPEYRVRAGDRIRLPPVRLAPAPPPADAAGYEWLGRR